jgi:hypothetical protein
MNHIIRKAKAEWKMGIELHDHDLDKRMQEIRRYERNGNLEIAQKKYILSFLGFPNRGAFPYWRSEAKEWQLRNEERFVKYQQNYNEKRRKDRLASKPPKEPKEPKEPKGPMALWRVNHREQYNEYHRNYYRKKIANAQVSMQGG